MDDDLKAVKNLVIVRALALISMGNTKAKACELVDISVSTFDRALEEAPEIASEFVAHERTKIVSLYLDISSARELLVKGLIKQAKKPDIGIRDALAIEQRLKDIQATIELELSLVQGTKAITPILPGAETGAEKFLDQMNGPALKHGKGVFRQTVTTLELSIDENKDHIIDGNVKVLDNETKS